MISNDSKIRVSYIEPGSVLKSRGVYTSAETKVDSTIIKKSETIKSPNYSSSVKTMILETPFIVHWLNRDNWKPGQVKTASDRLKFSVYKDWKRLDDQTVLVAAVKLLLADIGVNYDTAEIIVL